MSVATSQRRKHPLREIGSDPDYRFALANERTSWRGYGRLPAVERAAVVICASAGAGIGVVAAALRRQPGSRGSSW